MKTDRVAIAAIDIQNDFCDRNGRAASYIENLNTIEHAVHNTAKLLARGRQLRMPCVFVRSFMDNKYKLPSLLKKHAQLGITQEVCREGTWGSEFYDIAPQSQDFTVTKHTPDAFLYTFLEPLFRKFDVDTVIVCGVFTEICVESTVRSALQRGFHITIPIDCTAGMSEVCVNQSLDTMSALGATVVKTHEQLWAPHAC